ncbi:uncharacterized protein LOC131877644 isoform X1 [Tigriopus californicus]|uniref:uncharacterized protein LOC131877644 isoform X1 n=1 Tax=Tigriopus californicus TaxID=6832 RepID=UPI0027DA6C63|nr:uncharacterized protein LOC131877644 isoform X1 [Tigriopus californicus]
MIEESQCFLCQKPASNKCRSCNGSKLFFCGESHFNIHRSHGVCRKFFITWKEGVGNHMVASEEIKAGEIILIEDAAMNGPNRPRKQPFPSCLECLKPVKSGFRCPKCHFPTCDVQCSEGPNHAIECPVFANLEELPDFTGPCEEFSAIIPLRILALRESRPETWERVNLLMDHVEDWNEVDKALWTKMAEDLIQKRCKQSKYTAEELYRAAGIFLTNGVNQGTNQGHGLYPTFSFISHGCICNSRFQIHRDRKLVLRAQIDIPRGEEITTRYLPSMIGNIRRRFKIKNNWNFDCVCLRCQDPTELGSFIGITVCPKCSQAKSPITQGANETGTTNIEHEREDGNKKASAPPSLALLFAALIEKKKKEESDLKSRNGNLESDRPGYLLPSDPLEYFSNHVCDKCGYKVNGLTIFGLTKALEDEAEEFKTIDPVQVEEKLKAWLKVLHPNHYLILKLKKRMLDVLSLLPDPEDEAEFRKKLERQIALGTALLKVVEILEPGFSLSKGRILRQLHVPRITLAKIKFKNTEIDKGEFLKMTAEAIRNMKTAVKCLEDFGDEKMDANN